MESQANAIAPPLAGFGETVERLQGDQSLIVPRVTGLKPVRCGHDKETSRVGWGVSAPTCAQFNGIDT